MSDPYPALSGMLLPGLALVLAAAVAVPTVALGGGEPGPIGAGAVTIAIIGDSTAASYPSPPPDRPELTGWGQVFGRFFDDQAVVFNHAASGRSSRSFLAEGRWERALADHPNYVFIQFGHNDQPGKGERSTNADGDFRDFLRRYVREARAANARPVLVTPVARRTFQGGKIHTTLEPYADAVFVVGAEEGVPVVDLHALSLDLFGRLGDAGSADLSASASDRTHFSRVGALEMAQLVAGALQNTVPDLARHLRRGGGHQDLSSVATESGRARPIRTAGDWARRREQLLEGMKRAMGPLPGADERVPLDVRVQKEERVGNLTQRHITYASTRRQRVGAILLLPRVGKGQRAPAMLCLHPTGAPGKRIVADPTQRANRQYALELARRGYITLAPDYPSFGDYTCAFDPADGFQSGTMRAIWDNIRAVDLLQGMSEVDGGNLGVIGHSLGGHNAMYTAVFEPRLKAIVTSCGFNAFHRYREGNLAPWAQPCYMPRITSLFANSADRVPFDFPEVLAALAPRPFFTNSPLRDANFDVQGVRDCLTAARPIYEKLGAADRLQAVHPDCEHDFPDTSRQAAYEFLDRHLGRAPD